MYWSLARPRSMLTGAVGANEAESGTERLLADSACQARARQGVARCS